jgi:hypothetical protein
MYHRAESDPLQGDLMKTRLLLALAVGLVTFGCAGTAPVILEKPRSSLEVEAPFAKTWDAVIEMFADHLIPINTIDRSSGFIAAGTQRTPAYADGYADCGRDAQRSPYVPASVTYNVLLRGDSTTSTVRVTALWIPEATAEFRCVSTGVWEGQFERDVAARAEGRIPAVAAVLPTNNDLFPGRAVVTAGGARMYASPALNAVVRADLKEGARVIVSVVIDERWAMLIDGFGWTRGYVRAVDLRSAR